MIDERTSGEKLAWKMFGPPLYYCGVCMRKVKLNDGVINRSCGHNGDVIAPRRAILAGKGGLNPTNRATQAFDQVYSMLTGRTR